jgi:hypothetical protein
MHLKSYQIDGRSLRICAANFSACLKRQDNDLIVIVIESAKSAVAFKRAFDARFSESELLSAGAKQ